MAADTRLQLLRFEVIIVRHLFTSAELRVGGDTLPIVPSLAVVGGMRRAFTAQMAIAASASLSGAHDGAENQFKMTGRRLVIKALLYKLSITTRGRNKY